VPIFRLEEDIIFPHPSLAEEDGLLAVGGDLSIERLLLAYKFGIFPWFNEGDPILWWSPNPRCVLFPERVHISKSMKRLINKNIYNVRFNTDFEKVIEYCAEIRKEGTWITDEMRKAYINLFERGYAISVEIWEEDSLVGGLYGVTLGKCFFAESMFSIKTNTSKLALIKLCEMLSKENYAVIDCQLASNHLFSMGAENISREKFLDILENNI
jgi:leucyl/phenylalanyl-tRNA--protein transferase